MEDMGTPCGGRSEAGTYDDGGAQMLADDDFDACAARWVGDGLELEMGQDQRVLRQREREPEAGGGRGRG